jgi:hypothetical protein
VFKSWPRDCLSCLKVFHALFYSLQANAKILAEFRTWLVPFSSFPVNY